MRVLKRDKDGGLMVGSSVYPMRYAYFYPSSVGRWFEFGLTSRGCHARLLGWRVEAYWR